MNMRRYENDEIIEIVVIQATIIILDMLGNS